MLCGDGGFELGAVVVGLKARSENVKGRREEGCCHAASAVTKLASWLYSDRAVWSR